MCVKMEKIAMEKEISDRGGVVVVPAAACSSRSQTRRIGQSEHLDSFTCLFARFQSEKSRSI